MSNVNKLSGFGHVDTVIAVGSTDGILTAAAVLRVLANEGQVTQPDVQFCQAFTVDKVKIDLIPEGGRVVLVDLAVNNRDPQMTKAFVEGLRARHVTVVALIDEHGASDWEKILSPEEMDILVVKPETRGAPGAPGSSGEVLRRAAREGAWSAFDAYAETLCREADEADHMRFGGPLAGPCNSAVKSDIANDARRVYLAKHFAKFDQADLVVKLWVEEYQELLHNQEEVLSSATEKDGFLTIDLRREGGEVKVDMTSLMGAAYGRPGVKVACVIAQAFVPVKKAKELAFSFGLNSALKVDIMAAVKAAGVLPLGGFASKVTVTPEDAPAAEAAIRAVL